MEPGSSLALASVGNEDERSLMKLSITELISNLRTAFRKADYDRVEEVLVAKETKLMAEIGALEEKLEIERLDRMNVEEKLKKCKDQCEKGKKAEERYEKLLEVVKKSGLDDGNTIAELRIKNRKLEDEKLRTEYLAESWKGKFEELNERVLRLENGQKFFMNGDTHAGVEGDAEEQSGVGRNSKVECRADPEVSIVMEVKETKEVDAHGHQCGNNIADSSPSQRNARKSGTTRLSVGQDTRQSLGTSNKDVLGASANGSFECQTVIEIGESDDISRGTLNGKEATSQIVAAGNDNGHPSLSGAVQQKSLAAGVNDVNGMLKRKWVAGNSSGEFGNHTLDGCDTDDDTSTSSLESEFDVVQLPSNFLRNAIDKRRKT